jgi:excisionase family DNA binding protein
MKPNTQDLQFTLPIDKLAEAFFEFIKPHLVREVVEIKQDDDYLTRKEAATQLNITLPTLGQYTKKGLLTSYKIGARVLYKKSEIESAPLKVNYGRMQYD